MKRFYFTFGSSDNMPFIGGWVEIFARDLKQAANIFKKMYPNTLNDEVLNCADYYTEEQFLQSGMVKENLGKRCHAIILVNDFYNDIPKCFSVLSLE